LVFVYNNKDTVCKQSKKEKNKALFIYTTSCDLAVFVLLPKLMN